MMMSELRGKVFFKTGVKITLILIAEYILIMLYNTKKTESFDPVLNG